MAERIPLTVSQVTRMVKGLLEREIPPVWIVGEVSNLRIPPSGHAYFTLKDETCQIRAVAWRGVASQLKFRLEDGLALLGYGSVSVYESRGEYQVLLTRLEPKGVGALDLAFRQMKEKLEAEGLFDPGRRKPLPFLPRRVALVTSPTGAAVQDMIRTIHERCPAVGILVVPVRVQGEGAAQEVAAAIRLLNDRDLGVDVMVVGRGGGSLEDLWAFNEEAVARAIFASRIPVVSAVGHEVDVSISDLVADVRALTPTAAGELVVPDLAELMVRLKDLKGALGRSAGNRLALARVTLDGLRDAYGFRRLADLLRQRAQTLDEVRERLARSARDAVAGARERLKGAAARLDDLSPLKVLHRGYAILLDMRGRAVRRASDAAPGELLSAHLGEGVLPVRVEGKRLSNKGAPRGPGLFD